MKALIMLLPIINLFALLSIAYSSYRIGVSKTISRVMKFLIKSNDKSIDMLRSADEKTEEGRQLIAHAKGRANSADEIFKGLTE